MTALELAVAPRDTWPKIAFHSVTRILAGYNNCRQIVRVEGAFSRYCSFVYSALASFSMGMSESASFEGARKSW